MNPESLTSLSFLILKLFTLLGLLVYIVFAGIMVRQLQLMAQTVKESFQPILRILALLHLVIALGVFVLGLLFL